MAFLSCLPSQDRYCPLCLDPCTVNAVAHEGGGELHPIHEDCLKESIEASFFGKGDIRCCSCRCPIESINGVALEGLAPSQKLETVRRKKVFLLLRNVFKPNEPGLPEEIRATLRAEFLSIGVRAPSQLSLEHVLQSTICTINYIYRAAPLGKRVAVTVGIDFASRELSKIDIVMEQ